MSDWREAVSSFFETMSTRDPQELERLRADAWDRETVTPEFVQHRPIFVGGRDVDGRRDFTPQGEICERCTAIARNGRLVPVSECWQAMAAREG